jgi:hypothetical protein
MNAVHPEAPRRFEIRGHIINEDRGARIDPEPLDQTLVSAGRA